MKENDVAEQYKKAYTDMVNGDDDHFQENLKKVQELRAQLLKDNEGKIIDEVDINDHEQQEYTKSRTSNTLSEENKKAIVSPFNIIPKVAPEADKTEEMGGIADGVEDKEKYTINKIADKTVEDKGPSAPSYPPPPLPGKAPQVNQEVKATAPEKKVEEANKNPEEEKKQPEQRQQQEANKKPEEEKKQPAAEEPEFKKSGKGFISNMQEGILGIKSIGAAALLGFVFGGPAGILIALAALIATAVIGAVIETGMDFRRDAEDEKKFRERQQSKDTPEKQKEKEQEKVQEVSKEKEPEKEKEKEKADVMPKVPETQDKDKAVPKVLEGKDEVKEGIGKVSEIAQAVQTKENESELKSKGDNRLEAVLSQEPNVAKDLQNQTKVGGNLENNDPSKIPSKNTGMGIGK